MVKKIGKYELGKSLGSGTFGKVKYGIDVTDPKRTAYAIKILDRKQIEKENMQEQLKNEIAIMKLLKHENVVRMFEVIQSPQHIYMVLELITGGELFDRICQAKKFDEATARRYFQQLIFGVHYCHSQGVSHRDLKPENLLLDSNDSLKISDFGLSAITNTNEKSKLLQTTCGTPNYVAPEVLREKGYEGKLSDVWSCGVILFAMMAGYLPFDDPTMNGLFVKIERGDYRMPKTFSPGAKHLISRMLITNPSDRISMAQIMEDPWFIQGVSPEKIATAKMYSKIAPPTGDVSNAIQSESKDAEKAQSAEASQELRQDITAFELASRLVMGVLTPLTSKNQVTVRRNTQFICNGDADSVANAIENALKTCNANPSRGKKEKERVIKGYITAGKEAGLLQFVFTIYSTVCKDLTLVELRRARGDTLEFQKFYRRVVGDLKSICPKQPPAIEEDLQDQS